MLVYLFPRLGDALLVLPAVKALLRRAPSAQIDLLLSPLGARVLQTTALAVRGHALTEDLETLSTRLRRRYFDYAIDLTHRSDADARVWLQRSGAKVRAGFIRPDEDPASLGFSYGTIDDRTETHTHWSRSCVEPLRVFGVSAPDFDLPFRISTDDRRAARAAFAGPRRLLLVPGGQDPERRWPKERFIAIGRDFVKTHRGRVVVTGAPAEQHLVLEVARGIGGETSTFTGRSLRRLAAIVEASDILVGNDTGPVHYGFLMNKRVLSIFSRMSPEVWGPPYASDRFAVLRAEDSASAEENDHWSALAIAKVNELMGRPKR